jgi:hypothetical protein
MGYAKQAREKWLFRTLKNEETNPFGKKPEGRALAMILSVRNRKSPGFPVQLLDTIPKFRPFFADNWQVISDRFGPIKKLIL